MIPTVILCGGRGTRIAAHFPEVPKPLIEIGGKPILWHILRLYAAAGFDDFTLALGYKGASIRQWFATHRAPTSASTVRFRDTGVNAQTGDRILRLAKTMTGTFFATYGDGLADIDLSRLLAFHRSHGKIATLTAVRPRTGFGVLKLKNRRVVGFEEKPVMPDWVNGGFFVFEPTIADYIRPGDALEAAPMKRLARDGQIMAHRHTGFWQCMDTYKDLQYLDQLCRSASPPWTRGKRRKK